MTIRALLFFTSQQNDNNTQSGINLIKLLRMRKLTQCENNKNEHRCCPALKSNPKLCIYLQSYIFLMVILLSTSMILECLFFARSSFHLSFDSALLFDSATLETYISSATNRFVQNQHIYYFSSLRHILCHSREENVHPNVQTSERIECEFSEIRTFTFCSTNSRMNLLNCLSFFSLNSC